MARDKHPDTGLPRAPAVPDVLPHSPAGETNNPPKHGTQRPLDVGGVVPRVVHPLDRVPAGSVLRRFKIRCECYIIPKPIQYVLAHNEAEASKFYSESHELDKVPKHPSAPEPSLVVTQLPD